MIRLHRACWSDCSRRRPGWRRHLLRHQQRGQQTAGDINLDRIRGALSLGGTGGANVTVENDGSIITIGPMSSGIVAQSIAGGGGIAGASAAKVQGSNSASTSVLSLPISIGAGSGGGGIVRTRSSDAADHNGGGAVATGGSYGINVTFGPPAGQSGSTPSDAGTVTVNHTGSIGTLSTDAYGILAQSIGGGGALVQGGTPNSSSTLINGSGPGAAGSTVTVIVGSANGATSSVVTQGRGAVAVFAQSIGGGGGIAGDTGLTAQRASFSGQGQGARGTAATSESP